MRYNRAMKSIKTYFTEEALLAIFLSLSLVASHFAVFGVKVDEWWLILASIIGTIPVVFSAGRAVIAREISMDVLAGVALVFSLIGKEWKSAIFIALMLCAARVLTKWNEARTERNIEGLLKLRPETARVRKGSEIVEVKIEDIKIGDIIVAELGSRIPVDGVVVSGTASVDESSLTGESVPVDKTEGAKTFSSTLVSSGSIDIRAEKVGKETTLERMIDLVSNARDQKPTISTMGEKFGKIYIISIFVATIVLYVTTHNLSMVLAVVLVVCADDVAIAVPLAFLSAIGVAARQGVIVKGSSYLEEIGKARAFVFDKTGTITKGVLHVESVVAFQDFTEAGVISSVYSLAVESNHPLSKAIARYGQDNGIKHESVDSFEEYGGKGMGGVVTGKKVVMGKIDFLEGQNVSVSNEARELIEKEKSDGKTITTIAINGRVAGVIGVMDEIKPNVKVTLEELRKLGVKDIVMLTGDNKYVAARIAKEVGITDFHADLLPEDKLRMIQELSKKDGVTVMVGDGVNDAAALQIANIGVAMGAIGYDAAIESADIVLMKDDISRLVEVMKLSRYLRVVSIQDFWIWGITNIFGLALVFTGVIGPTGAAAYNFISDFIPLFNSLKVTQLKFRKHGKSHDVSYT